MIQELTTKRLETAEKTIIVDSLIEKIFPELNTNGKTLEILENKRPNIYIIGGTSGIGEEIVHICKTGGKERDFYPIGSRNPEKIKEISQGANKYNFGVSGDIFDETSEAYKFIIEQLPQKKGIIQFLSAIDMDPVPMFKEEIDPRTGKEWEGNITEEEKNNIRKSIYLNPEEYDKKKTELNEYIISDAIDPRNGEKREDGINDDKKKEIRKDIADKQIAFFRRFFEKLCERNSKDPITLVFANSVIAKYFESTFISSSSEYGRLKNEVSKMIEEYRQRLEEKNVFVKNIFLGITDTPMFSKRGPISAINTARLGAHLGPNLPLDGEELVASKPLNPQGVANFFYEIGNEHPNETPNRIPLYKDEHLNVESMKIRYKEKRKEVITEILESKDLININELSKNSEIQITDKIKKFLKELRQKSLKNYLERNGKASEEKLASNMNFADKIISELPKKVSFKSFVDICLRIEGNYP